MDGPVTGALASFIAKLRMPPDAFTRDQHLISTFPLLQKLQPFQQMIPCAHPVFEFLGPAWMDDLAVCVQGESPDQVVRKVRLVTGRLLELCMEHCMSPNVSKNKTEILFHFEANSLVSRRRSSTARQLLVRYRFSQSMVLLMSL
jgi:hypothetical protein